MTYKPFNKRDWLEIVGDLDPGKIKLLKDSYEITDEVINIRHDVDNDLSAALSMAENEFDKKIRATYFFLNTAPYWNDPDFEDVVMAISCMGHEIGWHNNAITDHIQTGKSLKHCICEPIDRLRKIAEVVGTAGHGDLLCYEHHYLNYYVFRDCLKNADFRGKFDNLPYTLQEFGLKYEAYHTGHSHYISDSGGEWRQNNLDTLMDFSLTGGKLQILIHPQWWNL